jgi:hypothetical protein
MGTEAATRAVNVNGVLALGEKSARTSYLKRLRRFLVMVWSLTEMAQAALMLLTDGWI